MKLSAVNPSRYEMLAPLTGEIVARPDQLLEALLGVIQALVESGKEITQAIGLNDIFISSNARAIAASLTGNSAVLLGNLAVHNPRYAEIYAAASAIAELTGAKLGVISEAANSVGAQLVGAETGGNVSASPKKAYFLLNAEAQFDTHNGIETISAVEAADFVVALNPFVDGVEDYADVILPIAPL